MNEALNFHDDCLFCKIVNGDIPSDKVYEDELCYAFRDINPQAPTHILVVPRTHIASCADLTEANASLVSHIFPVIARIAKDEGLDSGWRVVSNVGSDGGQSVPHLHFHILGGRALSGRMG